MRYTKPGAYDRFMGRWSARLAPVFVEFGRVRDGQRILDVGCGTGSLSRALLAHGSSIQVTGIDPTQEYVDFARSAITNPRACFTVGTAEQLAFADGSFDGALALLVVQDFEDVQRSIAEMARVTRSGGAVAACMWDFGEGLPMLSMMWQVARAVAPEAVADHRSRAQARYASIRDLEDLWRSAGLADIVIQTIELAMPFASFEDYWEPFLQGATPSSAFAAALDRQTGGAFAEALRRSIGGAEPGGAFTLPAKAWAIRGTTGE